jgi:hypothetical protein
MAQLERTPPPQVGADPGGRIHVGVDERLQPKTLQLAGGKLGLGRGWQGRPRIGQSRMGRRRE